MCTLVTNALQQCGAHVTAADSAVVGLAVLKRDRPDVLVSSLCMPEKDGYWLIGRVRSLPADGPEGESSHRALSTE